MKTEFKARFLQHLNQKRQDKGFTLIELLVVIIIIGILSAIALPSFLNQANKAKQSEAKQYAGSMNRAQQAGFAENGKFVGFVPALGLGIKTQTQNYKYSIAPAATQAEPTLATTTTAVGNIAHGQSNVLKSYIGAVALIAQGGADKTSTAVLCESTAAGVGLPAGPADAADITAENIKCNNTSWTIVSK
ncbi:MAG: type IV pilin-like G/H family protein [Microcoleus sp. PH2017_29_MFU_D_A]|uniref:type IV pilin-like G/H family protein n=1 Tax=unclassified Microcoleus TaxID=2642155 RepID=UPI001D449873|nr:MULTISPECIES: type IV pilin-like G/H family protein [unclassified Microcoleus]TAG67337.1 MAG: prepilin-type N-terminal cleavage/methylation domain-containing protein [Oscillatoriales cyanobacterium]MCC3424523.1 type IV pilin-like G/H family protein [Microcoleus sp. PH2017_01_SCD_O_A]MCC3455037.1 type IV pilin-like G/H family protein [Microcoleus sp. PH2017_08_TRC_O_A]MCC3604224.1 type IV pilin-like G/H family protein [Microcoleus sp. PH2017_29_MFU_D_A]MCC3635059.1 type IV pilin-like G/H fam